MEYQHLSAAIIPCFNEAGTIGKVVASVASQVMSVWVVDDGSSDLTRREAGQAGAAVIRHEVNLGKGASLRAGLHAVQAAGYKWGFTLDGDGQHHPADMPAFWTEAVKGADLVIGNRMVQAERMPKVRRFVNEWMSTQLSRRLNLTIPDSQCGFRLFRIEALNGISLRENRFGIESEVLAAFARAGRKIAFVPIQCLPSRRPSRIHPIMDTARWFRWWWRLPPCEAGGSSGMLRRDV